MNPLAINSCFVSANSELETRIRNAISVSCNVSFPLLERKQNNITKRRCIASVIICTFGSCINSEYIRNHELATWYSCHPPPMRPHRQSNPERSSCSNPRNGWPSGFNHDQHHPNFCNSNQIAGECCELVAPVYDVLLLDCTQENNGEGSQQRIHSATSSASKSNRLGMLNSRSAAFRYCRLSKK